MSVITSGGALETFITTKLWSVLASVCGAILPLAYQKNLHPRQIVMSVFGGISCSVFLTPVIANYTNADLDMRALIAFAAGLVGMKMVQGILKYADKKSDELIDKALDRATHGVLGSTSKATTPVNKPKKRSKARKGRR
jgi:hypothetical protein